MSYDIFTFVTRFTDSDQLSLGVRVCPLVPQIKLCKTNFCDAIHRFRSTVAGCQSMPSCPTYVSYDKSKPKSRLTIPNFQICIKSIGVTVYTLILGSQYRSVTSRNLNVRYLNVKMQSTVTRHSMTSGTWDLRCDRYESKYILPLPKIYTSVT